MVSGILDTISRFWMLTSPALKLDTLLKLSESTSYDLRAAYVFPHPRIISLTANRALRIISERSTKGDTRDLLLRDLTSENKAKRNRALNAMHFLVSNRACMELLLLHTFEEKVI